MSSSPMTLLLRLGVVRGERREKPPPALSVSSEASERERRPAPLGLCASSCPSSGVLARELSSTCRLVSLDAGCSKDDDLDLDDGAGKDERDERSEGERELAMERNCLHSRTSDCQLLNSLRLDIEARSLTLQRACSCASANETPRPAKLALRGVQSRSQQSKRAQTVPDETYLVS